VDWGDGTGVETVWGNAAWVEHGYRKHSADGGHRVLGKAYDGDGGVIGSGWWNVVVNDVPATVSVSGPGAFDTRDYYWLHLRASDVGDETQSAWVIDWGDGSTQGVTVENGADVSIEHRYGGDALGAYTVGVRAPGGIEALASQDIEKQEPVARLYCVTIGTDGHFPPSPGTSNPPYNPDSTAWLWIPEGEERRISTSDYMLFDPGQKSIEEQVMELMQGYADEAVFPGDAGVAGSGKAFIIDIDYNPDTMIYSGTITYEHPAALDDPQPHVWPIGFDPLRVMIEATDESGADRSVVEEGSEPQPQVGFRASISSVWLPACDVAVELERWGDATDGSDYTLGSVVIPAGQRSVWAAMTVVDDEALEADERVLAAVSTRSVAAPLAKGLAAAVVIGDNDWEAKAHDVTYGSDVAGAFHKVGRDYRRDQGGAYPSPHWTDMNGDGDANDANENKAPVSYTRSNRSVPVIGL
jgi:hypothetical protein